MPTLLSVEESPRVCGILAQVVFAEAYVLCVSSPFISNDGSL
jgi:hypothetical protein